MAQVHYVGRARDSGVALCRWSLRTWLEMREWNGEFVVWAADTGVTHLLSTLAGDTIKALRSGPASVEDIAARIFNRNAPASAATAVLVATFAESNEDTQRLLGVLNELETLGLTQVALA